MMNSNDPQHEDYSEESLLDSLRKPPPMAAPEGYFQSFGDRLKERIEEEELQASAPTLFGMARISPFKVPEGYFGQLPGGILKKLNSEQQPSTGMIRPMFLSLYATAAAAVIVLLVMWKGGVETEQPFPELPELSADELLAVVDIDEDLIIESLISEDLEVLIADVPIPVSVPAEVRTVEELSPVAEELSFDELLDDLEALDDADLDALEAELMDLEGEEWYD